MMKRFLSLVSILVTAGCSQQQLKQPAGDAGGKTAVVQVETVTVSTITDVYRASGTVRSAEVAGISAKITANIVEVRAHAGDHVEAGQTLIVLDRRDLDANLRRADAARTEAEAAVAEAEKAIASARASADLAHVTHNRFEDLLAKQSVSQQEFDESNARLKSAEAIVEMALARRRQAEARRSQTYAEQTAARVALGYATLAAPFSGLITKREVDPGNLATPGATLLTLEREGNLRFEAAIDESRVGLVKNGESVAVAFDGRDQIVTGRIVEIAPLDDPATRSFITKIELPATPNLRSGMFGHADFNAGKRDATLVPQSAILERGQIRCVDVVEGDITRVRFVTVGEASGDSREILSGLTPGERIIVAPPPLLADGARVAIQAAAK